MTVCVEFGKRSTTLDNSPLATFTAVPDLYPGNRGSGLVMEFQQNRGLLVATGNSVLLRCWDLTTEKCVSRFQPVQTMCHLHCVL